jgi:hypothetical protein
VNGPVSPRRKSAPSSRSSRPGVEGDVDRPGLVAGEPGHGGAPPGGRAREHGAEQGARRERVEGGQQPHVALVVGGVAAVRQDEHLRPAGPQGVEVVAVRGAAHVAPDGIVSTRSPASIRRTPDGAASARGTPSARAVGWKVRPARA